MSFKFRCVSTVLFISASLVVNAQTVKKAIDKISENLGTVQTSKTQYDQEIEVLENGYALISISEIDSKGKTETTEYEFSFSDIDPNTVRSITKKDLIQVQLLVRGKQKMIKKIEDSGEKVNFDNEIYLFASDIDNARNLVEAIKKTIPLSEKMELGKLSLSGYKQHINWLMKNIVEVDNADEKYIQNLTNDSKNSGYASLEVIEQTKSKAVTTRYEFNFSLLNPNSLDLDIKNKAFSIEVSTRRNAKFIKVYKDGIQQSYDKSLELYTGSMEKTKQVYKVLQDIIPLAEDAFAKSMPNITTRSKAIDYINGQVEEVSSESTGFIQNFSDDCVTQFQVEKTTSKGSEVTILTFNFADLNAGAIEFGTQKELLFIEIPVNQKAKLINVVKDGEQENYTDEFKIYINSVEAAIISIKAIENIISSCKSSLENAKISSKSTALKQLTAAIKPISINRDNYEQAFEIVSQKDGLVKFTKIFSDEKKSREQIYEFGFEDINPRSVKMETKGKNVQVELKTKYLEKIIKAYEDGEIKSYENELVIEAESVENARKIVMLLKSVAAE
ncbi:MAG: hypothetical protein AAF688_12285 [Bacteroidota bacterium]